MSDGFMTLLAWVIVLAIFAGATTQAFRQEHASQLRALHVACLQGGGTWTGEACTRGQP